jgi:transketolase
MFAAAQCLDNLLVVVDYNGVQSVGRSDELMGGADIAAKFSAFGWAARKVDGHDVEALAAAMAEVPFQSGKPSVIVAKTKAGAGVSFMEDQVLWHYRAPSKEDLDNALRELGQRPLHKEAQ